MNICENMYIYWEGTPGIGQDTDLTNLCCAWYTFIVYLDLSSTIVELRYEYECLQAIWPTGDGERGTYRNQPWVTDDGLLFSRQIFYSFFHRVLCKQNSRGCHHGVLIDTKLSKLVHLKNISTISFFNSALLFSSCRFRSRSVLRFIQSTTDLIV